jgi:surface protein
MYAIFRGCKNLTSLNLSNFNTSNVISMYAMFEDCQSLTSLDISGFDTSKVTTMTWMFNRCNKLTSLNIEGWFLNDVTQGAISTLPVGDDEKNEIYTTAYFTVPSGWTLINPLELAKYTTNAIGVRPTFNAGFTAYNASEIDNGDGTYTICIAANSLDDMPTTIYFRGVAALLTVEKISVPGLTDISQMIEDCANVTYINVSDLDVSQVTNMYRAIRKCNNLTTINVTGWDTRNVTSLYGTFGNNPKLETIIGLEGWNVENVETFREICTGNMALQTFNIGNWRNNKNTTTYGMFYNCRALTELDMGGFDMGSLTSTTHMFTDATGLTRFNSPTNIRMSIGFNSTRLDLESVLDIIDNLATVTTNQTLTLGGLADQLTEEQIAVAINKGWSIG